MVIYLGDDIFNTYIRLILFYVYKNLFYSGKLRLFIFMGTIGKSAQVPLQVWLPDAMWGPTPCSALIHAATMVAPAYLEINTGFTTTIATNGHAGTILHLLMLLLMLLATTLLKAIIVIQPVVTHLPPPSINNSVT